MIDSDNLVRWMTAALAVFVGLALIASLLVGMRASPSQYPANHARLISSPGVQFENAGQLAELPCCDHGVDHGACCGTACGLCVVAIDTAGVVLLDLGARHPRYALWNQVASGLAFPPLVGPPRS